MLAATISHKRNGMSAQSTSLLSARSYMMFSSVSSGLTGLSISDVYPINKVSSTHVQISPQSGRFCVIQYRMA